jgi:hypothetical protein
MSDMKRCSVCETVYENTIHVCEVKDTSNLLDYIVLEFDHYPDIEKLRSDYPEHRMTLVVGGGPYLVTLRR